MGKCPSSSDGELLVSNDAHYIEVFPNACKGAAAPAQLLGLPSLMHDNARLERANIEADTLLRGLTSALEVTGGWLLGVDRGEWGGDLLYIPSIHNMGASRDPQIARSGAEPLAIFRWRDAIYAVIGGPYVYLGTPSIESQAGSWPALHRLEEQRGLFVAKAIAHLPAPVIGVYGDNARLLMLTEHAGIVDLTEPQRPRWVGCMH